MEITTPTSERHELPSVPVFAPEMAPPQNLVIERLLRDRNDVWRQVNQEYRLHDLLRQMSISSATALFCYGLVIGMSHSVWQALSSASKLPILFLLTIAICLPTLYLFNLFYGGRLSVRQVLALCLAATTVTSAMMLAFAPITLFFLITAQSYAFFVLLNVMIFTLTGITGLQVLVDGTKAINRLGQQAEPTAAATSTTEASKEKLRAAPPATANMQLLYIWLGLFAFVGTQLGWTLRPFFGDPGTPFALFRSLEGNFYGAMINVLLMLLGAS